MRAASSRGTRRADDADFLVGLDPRPGDVVVCVKGLENKLRQQGALDRRAGDLPIALRVMAIADIDHPSVHACPQIDSGAGGDVANIHVPAEDVCRHAGAHLAMRRRHPERTVEGPQGRNDCRFVASIAGHSSRFAVNPPHPDALLLFRLKIGVVACAGQRPEVGRHRRNTPIARRLQALEMNRDHLSRLCAFDGDRSRQRIDIGKRRKLSGLPLRRYELARKAILGENLNGRSSSREAGGFMSAIVKYELWLAHDARSTRVSSTATNASASSR